MDPLGWTVIGDRDGQLVVVEDRDLALHAAATWELTPARILSLSSRELSHLAHAGSHAAMSNAGWRLIDPPRRLTKDEVANLVVWTVATEQEQSERIREERVRAKAAEVLEER